jgi:chromosome segregation ATPase
MVLGLHVAARIMTDMFESEVTIGLLREIRDEIKANRVELKSEIGELRSTLEVTNERLAIVEQTVNDAATQIVFVGRYIKNRTDVDIDDLKVRVSKLEAKLPD